MADYTVEIPLPDHKRGDRWPGIPVIGPVLVNGSTPSEALARVVMTLKLKQPSGRPEKVYKLDSDATDRDAPITIDNAATWAASVPPVQEFVDEAGEWFWDMAFYDAVNSGPLTFYKGILKVNPDV